MRGILYALLLALAAFAFTRTEGEKETPDGAPSVVLAVDEASILMAAESQAPATELVYENAAQEMAVATSPGRVLFAENGERSRYHDRPEYRNSTSNTLQKQYPIWSRACEYPLLEFQG